MISNLSQHSDPTPGAHYLGAPRLSTCSNHRHWQTWWKTQGWCQALFFVSVLVVLQPNAKIKSTVSIPNSDGVKTELYSSLNSELCHMLKLSTDIFKSLHVSFWRWSFSPVWGPKCSGSGFHLHLPVPSDQRLPVPAQSGGSEKSPQCSRVLPFPIRDLITS